ncbi:MAG: hypothetical protein JNK30_13560 [Phenylobacterium sp.]|uniref:hypothetical protein n=1 Tax=Phenylobacterium sp. TaxID=1871053 RepID=UPI001A55356D|nr:hypothetical protein [Phenylobacterium sp.]MBL8772403.1 hypothetical protein [Phenylobacterium sp.]
MIARLFALLALLALALSPLNAVAATRACEHMDTVAVAASADGAAMAEMPCCDPDPFAPMDPACAAKCVVMAGVVADLPTALVVERPAASWTSYASPCTLRLHAHPPPPLERPPRPLA